MDINQVADVRTLTLEIAGELAEHDASPLAAAVLRGLLETATTDRVNLVNAGARAYPSVTLIPAP